MDILGRFDEFDLRDYIKLILKRRKLILNIFLCAVIGTTIVCLLMPKVYEATALILISPSKIETAINASNLFTKNAQEDLSASPKPTLSLETHKVLLESSAVLERVIRRLNLVDQNGKPFLADDLLRKKMISLKEDEQTNIFQLYATDKDPLLAMNLANVWAQEYIQYSRELISGEIKGVGDFVEDQFTIAKKNLVQAEQNEATFKDRYKIDLMQAELTLKKNKLNSSKNDLLNMQSNIETQEDLLKELKIQIANQNRFIVTSKAMSDDAMLQQSVQEKDSADFDKMKIKSESINPIYQDLESRSINTETELNVNRSKIVYLQENIKLLEKDVNEIEKTFDQNQIEYDQLNRELTASKKTYDHFSAMIQEAQMAKAAELGEVKLVSTAYQPQHHVTSNIIKNIMRAGIIGLMVGFFVAFFSEWYWKKTL